MSVEKVFDLIMTFFIIIAFCAGMYIQGRRDAPQKEALDHYRQTYLWKCGASTLNGETHYYRFVSLDGGKSWNAVDRDVKDRVVILGPADKVNPELFQHVMAMDALMDHVTKHGPIDLSRPGERGLLEDAGFTITEKE